MHSVDLGSGGGGASRSFGERLFGALKLDASVYEEVEHDTSALGQAATVVLLAGFAQSVAAFGELGAGGALANLAGSFLGWAIGAGIVWVIGVKIMNCTSDFGELLRTLGFATAPGILGALGVLPWGEWGWVLGIAIFALSVVAAVIAVRQALDVSTGRAIVVCIIANLVPVVLILILSIVLVGAGVGVPTPADPGAMGF
ncbi:hypothetical protein MYXO_01350 [Myxococcaceae bacterium]|jgi:hypothetical protein|nr:hypothetical protein MYXO_01350 [Myxococcaceae bacterium]